MDNVIIEESNNRYKLIISDEQQITNPIFWKMPAIIKLNDYFTSKPIKDVENLLWHFENTKDVYGSTVGFVRDIIRQIRYLEKRNLGFLYLTMDDIIVYYDRFFIVNASNLYPLTAGAGVLEITAPYPIKDDHRIFLSPEVDKKISLPTQSLPAQFNKTSCYYSVGKIIEAFLANYNILETSVAHVIKRATHEDGAKRYLHFI
jgi:hypothetical protein